MEILNLEGFLGKVKVESETQEVPLFELSDNSKKALAILDGIEKWEGLLIAAEEWDTSISIETAIAFRFESKKIFRIFKLKDGLVVQRVG